jgi:chromate transporter
VFFVAMPYGTGVHGYAGEPSGVSRPGSPRELFAVFTQMALQGFGGVVVVAQRVLCEEKRWLKPAEFVEMLSIGQVVPGPNVCNVALMLGDRFFGWRGAVAALGGLLTVPFGIVLALVAVYMRWAESPALAGALRGMGAVSAGLIAGTVLKLAQSLRASPLGVPISLLLGVTAFILVGLLRVPLVWALLAVGPLACGLAWRRVGGGPR